MDLRIITDTVSVSPQITVEDIATLKAQDVTMIIMNRPDGEEPGQPDTAALKAAAEEHGIAWRDVPVVSGQFTPDAIAAMAEALHKAPGKVHAFCRSGTRSCFLWGMAEAMVGEMPPALILDHAEKAGYDMSPAKTMLETVRLQSI